VKIWEHNVYGKEKFSSRYNLDPLKSLMEDQNYQTLYDIYDWDETTGNEVG
jgi:hypothetical protein